MHTWENPEIYTIRTVNQASQNDCRKETQMKCPINLIQTATRARLRDLPLSLLHAYPHALYSFPLTCFTTFHLCGNSLLQRPGPLSLTTGLMARIWFFHHRKPASLSGWESKPCSQPLWAEVTRDQGYWLGEGSGIVNGRARGESVPS